MCHCYLSICCWVSLLGMHSCWQGSGFLLSIFSSCWAMACVNGCCKTAIYVKLQAHSPQKKPEKQSTVLVSGSWENLSLVSLVCVPRPRLLPCTSRVNTSLRISVFFKVIFCLIPFLFMLNKLVVLFIYSLQAKNLRPKRVTYWPLYMVDITTGR